MRRSRRLPPKPAFRSAWKERRCLVRASGYYEWDEVPVEGQKKPRKQPYYITRKDGGLFTFAGLWERWKDGMLSFTILTTEGSAVTRHLHDRMPVSLDRSGFAGWLDHGKVERPDDFDTAGLSAPQSYASPCFGRKRSRYASILASEAFPMPGIFFS